MPVKPVRNIYIYNYIIVYCEIYSKSIFYSSEITLLLLDASTFIYNDLYVAMFVFIEGLYDSYLFVCE